jgi:hypothetical protein
MSSAGLFANKQETCPIAGTQQECPARRPVAKATGWEVAKSPAETGVSAKCHLRGTRLDLVILSAAKNLVLQHPNSPFLRAGQVRCLVLLCAWEGVTPGWRTRFFAALRMTRSSLVAPFRALADRACPLVPQSPKETLPLLSPWLQPQGVTGVPPTTFPPRWHRL